MECEIPSEYYVEIEDFFKGPAKTTDWLAHLSEKNWIDWTDFMNMIHRFREGTDSFFA